MKQELDAIDLTRGKQPLTSTLTLEKARRPAQKIAEKLGIPRSQPRRLTPKERLAEQQKVAKKTQPKPEIKEPRKPEIKFPAKGKQEFKKAWETSAMKKGDVDENMRKISRAIEKNPEATPQVYVKAETGEIVTQQAFNHSDLIIKSGMKHSDVIDSGWKVGDDFYSYFYGKLPKPKPKDIKLPKQFGKVKTVDAETVVYHGSKNDIVGELRPDKNGVFWVTRDKKWSRGYGQNTIEFVLPENKILKESNPVYREILKNAPSRGYSKSEWLKQAEKRGYLAIERGNEIATRVKNVTRQKPKDIKLPKEFGRVEKEVPVFTPKTNTPQATIVGKQFKGNEKGIEVLERRMIQYKNRAEQFQKAFQKGGGKDLNILQNMQGVTHRSAMYREAWEVATGRMPELLDDIKPFFEKRKKFLDSLDEIAGRAEKRIKMRWDESARKFYGGLPIDPIRTVSDLADLSIIGAQRIVRGANTSAKFANEMIKTYGDRIKPHLDALYKKSLGHVKRFMKAVEDKAHELPSIKKALSHYQKGEYAAEWYNKTGEEIRKIFGDKDGDMFLDFVAITSPQTTPKANVTKALELFKRWKLGQTGDEFKYGTGEQWKFFKSAIKGEEFGGRKIQNFRKNLKGDLDPVTVDMWMFEIYFGKTNGTPIQFKFIEEDVQRLAKELGKKPAEVQAAMWVGYKELPQNVKRGGEGSYDAIEHYVKQQFAASKTKSPDAWLLDGIRDRMAKTGVKEAKVELGGKKFVLDLMKAAGKDIKNTELGITANPYRHIEEFLGRHKLVLTDKEKQTIKTFMQSLAQRKLLSTAEAEREINRFIESQFGERFKVISDVRKVAAKEMAPTPPDTRKWYVRWLDGETFGDLTTKAILRKAMGARKRNEANAYHASKNRMDWFDRQADEFNTQFMSQIERGAENIKNPKLRAVAQDYRRRLDRAWADSFVESGGKQAYIEDYFPHLWKDPGRAKKFFNSAYSGLYKSPGFLKKRYYDYIDDGIEAGLELKTTNPELLVLEREMAGFRYRETKTILDELKGSGYLKLIKPNERPPEGWSRLTRSKVLEVFIPQHGKIGEFYVPEEARKVLDNYLSKGFWSMGETPFKEKIYKGLRGLAMTKNILVALKLGLSGFHFVETTTSSHASMMGSALQAAARGDIRKAISRFGMWLPVYGDAMVSKKGKDIYSAWKTGKFKNDWDKWAVEQIELAGGSLEMPIQYKKGVAGQWQDMLRNYRKGKYGKATLQIVPAVMEQIMKPLMEVWIPRMKAYNFTAMVEDFAKRNPQIRPSSREWEKSVQKLWDSVDNRFGQLQYDNLFFNRMARDIGVLSQISMGWNIGTFREFGGGVIDMSKAVTGAALKHKPNVLVDRALYTAMYTAHFATIGGTMTYLMTGEYPKQILDFFYPRTGTINPDGTAERVQMPTMLKEAAALPEALRKEGVIMGALAYGSHKLAPIFRLNYELLTNKNFYGVDIRDPNAPIFQQMEQLGQHLFEQGVLPISISSFLRHRKVTSKTDLANSVLPFVGFSIAPGYVTKTPIQKEIFDLFRKRIGGSQRTRKQWDDYQKRAEVKRLIAIGKPKEALAEFLKLQKEGLIPRDTKWTTYKRTYMTPSDIRAFGRLPKEDQDYLWEKMTPEERLKYKKHYHKLKKVPLYIPN